MTLVNKGIAVLSVTGLLTIGSAGIASAADTQQPVVNCYPLLSAIICYLPVNVGPFGPFNFNVNFPQP